MQEFQVADDHLRETLPPIVQAVFSVIPPLLGCHVLVQNKLLGLYYTFLHNYCEEQGFPSPPPRMEQVVADWSATFKPVQQEIEAIPCIARGKTIHQSMRLGNDGQPRQQSAAPPGEENGPKRSTSGLIPGAGSANGTRQLRIPSAGSIPPVSPGAATDGSPDRSPRIPPSPGFGAHLRATDFTTATVLGREAQTPPALSPSVLRSKPSRDYFNNQPPISSTATTPTFSPVFSSTGAVVAKKKPPPPPPPKRLPSGRPDEFVIALYTFTGQGEGDLSFREGDRIKIVKKTQTEQDWWVGEINGARGSFPANYCRAL